jgi:hypothetical protein
MMQVFAEKDRIAQHLFPLEGPLSRSQPQMTVKNVQDRARLDFDIDTQAVSRLTMGLVAQVVFLLMQNTKRAEHGDSKSALLDGPGRAEKCVESEIAGEHVGLIIVR